MLVGVDDHSDYPVDVVADLPRIGPDLGVDAKAVAALKPDLVLTSLTVPGHEKCVADLEAAGLPTLVCQPFSLADVAENIRRIAGALGVADRGEALASQFESDLARNSQSQQANRPRILVEWWPKPVIVPGQKSWVTGLIELAGGTNPFADRDIESSPVTDEEVIEARPDAVVISWCGVPEENYRPRVVRRRDAWSELPALKHNRIYPVTEAWLGRPGPRLLEGLRALKQIVADCEGGHQ